MVNKTQYNFNLNAADMREQTKWVNKAQIDTDLKKIEEGIQTSSKMGYYSFATYVPSHITATIAQILTDKGFKVNIDKETLEVSWE